MDFFKGFFGKKSASGEMAKNRLQLVLIQDRTDCNPRMLEYFKRDLIEFLRRYMDIDEEEMDIEIGGQKIDGDSIAPTLSANIPIKNLHMPR